MPLCRDSRHQTPCPLPCSTCEADGCIPEGGRTNPLDPTLTHTSLVSFVYTDNNQAYIERVILTTSEEHTLAHTLDAAQRRGQITDVYIGPEQSMPTPFATFYPALLHALSLT